MSNDTQFIGGVEPMIDAKQAAAALRLPYYWFADHAMRAKYRIPHYLRGGLVRYRLSELTAWHGHWQPAKNQTDGCAISTGTDWIIALTISH